LFESSISSNGHQKATGPGGWPGPVARVQPLAAFY
jgi:hypothetical protein